MNGDLEINRGDMYDFPSNKENGNDENEPSIAQFVDGSGFMNNRNILQECEELNVERVGANGTMVDNGGSIGGDEVFGILKHVCIVAMEMEEKEKVKESGACVRKVQMNVAKANIHSTMILRSKSNGEMKVAEVDANEIQNNVVPHSMGFTSLIGRDMDKGKKKLLPDSQVPIPCAPPCELFKSGSTTLNALKSSRVGAQLLNIWKVICPSMNQSKSIASGTDDETLEQMAKKQKVVPLGQTKKLSNLQTMSLKMKDIIINGRLPKVGKSDVKEGIQVKKKRIMQPFAVTPTKRHG